MKSNLKTIIVTLVGVVVLAGLAYWAVKVKNTNVSENLQTGNVEITGNIVDSYAVGNSDANDTGTGVTLIHQIKTDGGSLVDLAYFTNPSLGSADPYLTTVAPRIKTDLSTNKHVRIKGQYNKDTNKITLDQEGDFVQEEK